MRIALDSNILVYSAGVFKVEADRTKKAEIRSILEALSESAALVCPLQTLGEAYNVMRRSGRPREQCREKLLEWRSQFETVPSSADAFLHAIDLATDHGLQFWDALILNVAAEAKCEFLLSEDMQPGFHWRGITVANPFAETLDKRLARLIEDHS